MCHNKFHSFSRILFIAEILLFYPVALVCYINKWRVFNKKQMLHVLTSPLMLQMTFVAINILCQDISKLYRQFMGDSALF